MKTIYNFKVEGISGDVIDFADFKGKKIMVLNVASECGYTPQYQQLQELYESFNNKLVVIGFPANNFGAQEPGSNRDIQAFCTKNYGLNFPLAAKIDIDTHPLYQWLTKKSLNGVLDNTVEWNFQKYLCDENGHLVNSYPSSTSPIDDKILNWVNS